MIFEFLLQLDWDSYPGRLLRSIFVRECKNRTGWRQFLKMISEGDERSSLTQSFQGRDLCAIYCGCFDFAASHWFPV